MITILHLTDIHCGSGELIDEDGKVKIPRAQRARQLDVLSSYLSDLDHKPDFVVVSGDITIQGDRGGLNKFREWLTSEINNGTLPSSKSIFIVPGNHDVTREKKSEDDDANQFREFWDVFGFEFPHAFIPKWDPRIKLNFYNKKTKLFGGVDVEMISNNIRLNRSLPFILDLKKNVLIFGFNSAHGCGKALDPDQSIISPLNAMIELADNPKDASRLKNIKTQYQKSLIIDAGLITDNQLQQFSSIMRYLERSIGDEAFKSLTKVATLHHHVSNIWNQQLEMKSYEMVLDAAQLKQALTEYGFDMVLHGHKHTNHVGIDGSLIPVDQADRFDPLCIISGGTIGGHPRLNDTQSFKIIEFSDKIEERAGAIVREIPLVNSPKPKESMRSNAKLYNIPISKGSITKLHDFDDVKNKLDDHLILQKASELIDKSDFRAEVITLQNKRKNIFSDEISYKCHSMLKINDSLIFYEVIQLTKRLEFKDIARIKWLVNDVIPSAADAIETKLVILIGTFEGTHYTESSTKGETEQSIDRLKRYLSPAITSGSVEIRTHCFSQQEISSIVT